MLYHPYTKMLFLILIVTFWHIATGHAQHKQVCITVDDLPVAVSHNMTPAHKADITQKLVTFFSTKKIPAIGFVNEFKLYHDGVIDSVQVKLLEQWLSHGLALGNHSYAHLNYHTVDYNTYTSDILKGEIICKSLCQKYEQPFHYFRHPYLKSGQTQDRADSLTAFLTAHHYTAAPVTLDNEDYLFAKPYESAFHNHDNGWTSIV